MKTAAALVVSCLAAVPVLAQQPRAVNARVVVKPAESDLQRAIGAIAAQQVEPAWVGYTVPIFNRDTSGRQDGWSERCRLEQTTGGGGPDSGAAAGPIRLEASQTLMVLIRLQNREVQRIRALSNDCVVDAGALTLYWLEGVNAAQSVVWLKGVAETSSSSRPEEAMTAISLHLEPAAAVALLDLARNSTNARIRQRALVAVALRAESQAAGTISEAIARDPDLEVKKQAVFALSRLPPNEGVPLLITLAKSNTNPAVRKQAIFWLGQSRDPRALAFFEEVLR